jgi:hypothetical protein
VKANSKSTAALVSDTNQPVSEVPFETFDLARRGLGLRQPIPFVVIRVRKPLTGRCAIVGRNRVSAGVSVPIQIVCVRFIRLRIMIRTHDLLRCIVGVCRNPLYGRIHTGRTQ